MIDGAERLSTSGLPELTSYISQPYDLHALNPSVKPVFRSFAFRRIMLQMHAGVDGNCRVVLIWPRPVSGVDVTIAQHL